MCISHCVRGARDGRDDAVTRRTGRKSGLQTKDLAPGLTASGLLRNDQGLAHGSHLGCHLRKEALGCGPICPPRL